MARRTRSEGAGKPAGVDVAGATVGYEAELWRMADTLRGPMAAAEYKHVVLGCDFPQVHRVDFDFTVGAMLQGLCAALLESRALAALRDALLPKLICGKFRVKDAERFSAEVAS